MPFKLFEKKLFILFMHILQKSGNKREEISSKISFDHRQQ